MKDGPDSSIYLGDYNTSLWACVTPGCAPWNALLAHCAFGFLTGLCWDLMATSQNVLVSVSMGVLSTVIMLWRTLASTHGTWNPRNWVGLGTGIPVQFRVPPGEASAYCAEVCRGRWATRPLGGAQFAFFSRKTDAAMFTMRFSETE